MKAPHKMGTRQPALTVVFCSLLLLLVCHLCQGASLRGSSVHDTKSGTSSTSPSVSASASSPTNDNSNTTTTPTTTTGRFRASLVHATKGHDQKEEISLPNSIDTPHNTTTLICDTTHDALTDLDRSCRSDPDAIPVCVYSAETRDYKTKCLIPSHHNNLTKTAAVVVRNHDHDLDVIPTKSKSYCGPCRFQCFQDTEELHEAVQRYETYTKVDVALQQTYGWPIGQWCVDKITSLSGLFFNQHQFNENINAWTTSQVTDMTGLFQNAYAYNQPLDQWDTSRVESMSRMFAMAIHFDQDLSKWDVAQVTDTSYMFLHAVEFNQPLHNWHVHAVTSLKSMFLGASKFQQNLTTWDARLHKDADRENMCPWTAGMAPPSTNGNAATGTASATASASMV